MFINKLLGFSVVVVVVVVVLGGTTTLTRNCIGTALSGAVDVSLIKSSI